MFHKQVCTLLESSSYHVLTEPVRINDGGIPPILTFFEQVIVRAWLLQIRNFQQILLRIFNHPACLP